MKSSIVHVFGGVAVMVGLFAGISTIQSVQAEIPVTELRAQVAQLQAQLGSFPSFAAEAPSAPRYFFTVATDERVYIPVAQTIKFKHTADASNTNDCTGEDRVYVKTNRANERALTLPFDFQGKSETDSVEFLVKRHCDSGKVIPLYDTAKQWAIGENRINLSYVPLAFAFENNRPQVVEAYTSRRLVYFIHGFCDDSQGECRRYFEGISIPLQQYIQAYKRSDVDIQYYYGSVNSQLEMLALDLNAQLGLYVNNYQTYTNKNLPANYYPYSDVYIVTHSLGQSVLRQAVLFANRVGMSAADTRFNGMSAIQEAARVRLAGFYKKATVFSFNPILGGADMAQLVSIGPGADFVLKDSYALLNPSGAYQTFLTSKDGIFKSGVKEFSTYEMVGDDYLQGIWNNVRGKISFLSGQNWITKYEIQKSNKDHIEFIYSKSEPAYPGPDGGSRPYVKSFYFDQMIDPPNLGGYVKVSELTKAESLHSYGNVEHWLLLFYKPLIKKIGASVFHLSSPNAFIVPGQFSTETTSPSFFQKFSTSLNQFKQSLLAAVSVSPNTICADCTAHNDRKGKLIMSDAAITASCASIQDNTTKELCVNYYKMSNEDFRAAQTSCLEIACRISNDPNTPNNPDVSTGGPVEYALSLATTSVSFSSGTAIPVTWNVSKGANISNDGIRFIDSMGTSIATYFIGTNYSGTITFAAPTQAGTYSIQYIKDARKFNWGFGSTVQKTIIVSVVAVPTYTITIPKIIMPGDDVPVSWKTASVKISNKDRIAIFAQGANNQAYTDFKAVTTVAGTTTFKVPVARGIYEVRYLKFDASGYISVAKQSFEIKDTYKLVASSTVQSGGELQVSWATPVGLGVNVQKNAQSGYFYDFEVALCQQTSSITCLLRKSVRGWSDTYTTGESGNFVMTPIALGTYDLRFYRVETPSQIRTILATTTVTVTAKAGVTNNPQNPQVNSTSAQPVATTSIATTTQNQVYTLTVTPTTVQGGKTVTVSWSVPANATTTKDWIGIFNKGASNQAYLIYKYTTGRVGATTLLAPIPAGEYEIRYLKDNGYTDVIRIPLTITAKVSTSILGGSLRNLTANLAGGWDIFWNGIDLAELR